MHIAIELETTVKTLLDVTVKRVNVINEQINNLINLKRVIIKIWFRGKINVYHVMMLRVKDGSVRAKRG